MGWFTTKPYFKGAIWNWTIVEGAFFPKYNKEHDIELHTKIGYYHLGSWRNLAQQLHKAKLVQKSTEFSVETEGTAGTDQLRISRILEALCNNWRNPHAAERRQQRQCIGCEYRRKAQRLFALC